MTVRRFVFGLVWLAAAPGAVAAEASPVVARHEVAVQVKDRAFKLWLLSFDPARVGVRVLDNPHRNGRWRFDSLPAAMEAAHCLAGVNGSFFRPEASPIVPAGLVISDGRRVMPLDGTSWMRGVFAVRTDGLALGRTEEFTEDARIVAALQSGPWLVRDAQAAADLDPRRIAKRTFVATDGSGRWALGIAEPCSLHELAQALRHAHVRDVLEIATALNLDGGPSTGLWQKEAPGAFYLPEGWPVSNFIGLVARR